MRRKISLLIAAAVMATMTVAAPALAQGESEANNCAGKTTSSLAGPGFGTVVAFFAQQQAVDNFGLASCGNAGQNP
jgi:hypothetical protein